MHTTSEAPRSEAGVATAGHLDDLRQAISPDILATCGVERTATAEPRWSRRLTLKPLRSVTIRSTGHTTTRASTRSPRRWRTVGVRLLMAAALGVSVAACGTINDIEPGNAAAVRAAIAARLPGVTATDIDPIGDGFSMNYRLSVGLTSTTARTADAARAQARMTARIVWDLADTSWTTLTVTTGCAPAPDACTGITLTVHADGAQQLWGPPASVEHRPPVQPPDYPETALAGRFDLVAERRSLIPPGWELHTNNLYIPDGLDEHARVDGVDGVLRIRWRDTLGPPPELSLNVCSMAPLAAVLASTGPLRTQPCSKVHLTPDQARARFGTRAGDLN